MEKLNFEFEPGLESATDFAVKISDGLVNSSQFSAEQLVEIFEVLLNRSIIALAKSYPPVGKFREKEARRIVTNALCRVVALNVNGLI